MKKLKVVALMITSVSLFLLGKSAALAEPPQLLHGKSIVVSWTEQRMQRPKGEGQFRPATRLAEFSVRLLFNNPVSDLEWTPDGKYLLVAGGRQPEDANDLQRVTVETGEVKTLRKVPADALAWSPFALSPDGRQLVAVLTPSTGKGTQLFRLTPDSEIDGEPTIAPVPTEVQSIRWTPDGRELVYRISLNVPIPLYRVRLPDGVPTPMPWVGADATFPTFSASKRRLVFRPITLSGVTSSGFSGASSKF